MYRKDVFPRKFEPKGKFPWKFDLKKFFGGVRRHRGIGPIGPTGIHNSFTEWVIVHMKKVNFYLSYQDLNIMMQKRNKTTPITNVNVHKPVMSHEEQKKWVTHCVLRFLHSYSTSEQQYSEHLQLCFCKMSMISTTKMKEATSRSLSILKY